MLILLTTFHTLHIFKLSLTDFCNFPGPVSFFQDFPVLENARVKFQDFPGFPGPVQTLISPGWWFSFLFSSHVCLNMYWYCLEKLDFNLSWEYLRNRKHVPCFYRVIQTRVEVWKNEKCCGNTSHRQVFPQLFRVLPSFHECLYNSIEIRSTCFLFLLENNATRKRKTTF